MTLTPGTFIGPYEVIGPLGAGGMGEVFRARDTRLGRTVAIKALPAASAQDRERVARFKREAQVLATLNHPNIAAIYGVEESNGVQVLVLELVEGEDLAERLRRGALSPRETVAIAKQIALGLEEAHEKGIVHRDLKPANLKLNPDGVVKILDFGLARIHEASSVPHQDGDAAPSATTIESPLTEAGIVHGTPAYMSPEQARGKALDPRSDIWAFGCIVYEMLTGRRAFTGATTSDIIAKILEREPDWSAFPEGTPLGLQGEIRRCLQKDARLRLRHIGDMRFEWDEAVMAGPASRSPLGRERGLLGGVLIAAAGAALALLTVAALPRWRPAAEAVPAFGHFMRLVATPANEFGPAISPDGRWVAYLSDARGPTDVWVKFVTGGDPVNLTASTGLTVQSQDPISGLDISPDGTQIAFIASRAPQTLQTSWVIPAPLGGVPRPLLKGGDTGLHWSPDGKQVAFTRAGGSAGDALGVADADGQNDRDLVPRQNGHHIHWVRWAQDGKHIYFDYGIHNFAAETGEVYRVPVSGGPIEPVVTTTRRAMFPFPDPGGRGLYYAADRDSDGLTLWWRDLTTGRDHELTPGIAEYGAPSVSADGRTLLTTLTDVRRSLWRIPVRFDQPIALEPLTGEFAGDLDPSASADGGRLVVSSSRDGHRQIWSMAQDLSRATPLTSGTSQNERPVFSPDGQKVAFVSDRGGHRGIWLVGVDGGPARLLLEVEVLDTISFSPDGREIVFAVPGSDGPGLSIVTVADGISRRLPTPGKASAPAWSPRDDLIAYVEPVPAPGASRLRFVSRDGQPRHQEIPDVADHFGNGFPSWSADGRRLAVAGLPGARAGYIWIFEPGGSTPPRKLLDLPTGVYLRGMAWTRDGSSLVVGRIQWSSDIVLASRTDSAPR